jgi:hypothetical protein
MTATFSRVAAMLLLAITIFGVPSGMAHAQAKPALVRNIDEPGRNPYQQSISFQQNTFAGCTINSCVVTFNAVPAGRRLVVTYVSARYHDPTFFGPAGVSLGLNGNVGATLVDLPRNSTDNAFQTIASPLTFYVEAGDKPTVFIAGGNLIVSSFQANVAVAGYFVSLP